MKTLVSILISVEYITSHFYGTIIFSSKWRKLCSHIVVVRIKQLNRYKVYSSMPAIQIKTALKSYLLVIKAENYQKGKTGM
jgi:hypothetical protein